MPEPIIQQAVAAVRSHFAGELRFDEHLRPLRYVTAPDGLLIAPVMVAMARSVDTVLFVPECADDALEAQVTIEQFEETAQGNGALTDRWRIYHGEPEDVNWARLCIDAVRFRGHVIDGDAVMQPNPLADDMPRLCRQINTDLRDAVRLLCEHIAETDVASPVVVGIDSMGIDVRRKFDVVRIAFDAPQGTADAAMAELRRMIDDARRASKEQPS